MQTARLLSVQKGSCVRSPRLRTGHGFPESPHAETASRFGRRFWDALSATGLWRKLCPILSVYSGMQFPPGVSFGKRVPFLAFKPGCSFRRGLHPETASHSVPRFRDAVSAKPLNGKLHPIQKLGRKACPASRPRFKLECRLNVGIGYLPSSSSASSLA